MTAFDHLYKVIDNEMVPGNRHTCRYNRGFETGGLIQELSTAELEILRNLVISRSDTPDTATKEWDKATEDGVTAPICWETRSMMPDEAVGWDDPVSDKGNPPPKQGREKDNCNTGNGEVKNLSQMEEYLCACFQIEDVIGWATQLNKSLKPISCQTNTVTEILARLKKYPDDLDRVIGFQNAEGGAFIKINPFNLPIKGKAPADSDVAQFRNALVESDELSIEEQRNIYREMKLPIAALVHSGGKSLHAIVKINADSIEEYKKRVEFLYEQCNKKGLKLDKQNKNPSRYSRMPGVKRNGAMQNLEATHKGCDTWEKWVAFVEESQDDLPEIVIEKYDPKVRPVLARAIIHGVLRQGHKMIWSGPSKAGKSMALLNLSISVASGEPWMGFDVERGRVLYINLELDPPSCKDRIWEICNCRGGPDTGNNFEAWHLRDKGRSLSKLYAPLMRRIKNKEYAMVIVDPLYKVHGGDECSATDTTLFFSQCDKICAETGAAVVVCHHHSKGNQTEKQGRDRSSGSGVFHRDPDAVLDLIECNITDEMRNNVKCLWGLEAIEKKVDTASWHCQKTPNSILKYAQEQSVQLGNAVREALWGVDKAAEGTSAWQLECKDLREFPGKVPKRFFYRYPVHIAADEMLSDARLIGQAGRQKNTAASEPSMSKEDQIRKAMICSSFEGNNVPVDTIAKYFEKSESLIRRWIREKCKNITVEGTLIKIK